MSYLTIIIIIIINIMKIDVPKENIWRFSMPDADYASQVLWGRERFGGLWCGAHDCEVDVEGEDWGGLWVIKNLIWY